jgi:hypothetical protein
MQEILIERIGPYGVMAGGEWFGLDKNSNLTPESFQKGLSYQVEVFKTAKGKSIIKSFMRASDILAPGPQAPITKAGPSKPKAWGRDLSEYEVEKDKRIRVSGIVQAVANSPAIVPFVLNQNDYATVVKEEARKIMAVANELVEEQ